jgi:hypothetical protein
MIEIFLHKFDKGHSIWAIIRRQNNETNKPKSM